MRKRRWIILCLVIGLCLALGAFADTEGDFTYTVENGEATVTAYVGGGNVVIPDTLGGYPVTAIGYQAFRYGSLTGVAFPSTLTSIGEEAFSGCFYLASVEFPTGLTEIGPFAFEYCAMSSVELPDTVTTVGGYAFRGCAALVDLRLSPAMTRIGNGTFRECTALQSVVIPASVTSIGTAAFQYCSLLSSITIPSSLTAIESSAFGSTAFTQFTCPATVAVVEDHTFSDCPNLESLTIWNPDCRLNVGETFAPVSTVIYGRAGSTAQTYAETYDREFVAVTCAHAGETPWTVVTPATCTEEGYRTRICAVCGDTVGENIAAIPHTSEEIPAVPATLTESGLTAGARCSVCGTVLTAQETTSPLLTYTVENGEATITACDTSVAGAIVLPDTLGGCPVTAIGASAFWKCSRITSVSVPASVTVIGRAAFSRCSALESISLPAGLTYINTDTFYQCAALSTVEIPAAVTGVGEHAFYHCDALESVTFAAGSQCARIEDSAFHFCDGLAEITLPSTVTSIGQYVFYGCDSLTDFVIPSSVTSIGRYAFLACTGLESVTIPSSVVSLGSGAFSNCHALQSVEILASLTSIGQETFTRCDALTSVTIPSTVTSIGQNAFSSCVSLESITIPSSVTSIGKYAFNGCALLESITIPASVTSIAEQAFDNCASLNRIVFLNPTCTIYDRAATIPASTTVFGYANSTAQSYAEKYDRSFSAIACAHGNFGAWTVESEATCAAEGYRTHLCGICNNTVGESIPTLPHTPETILGTPATCTSTGLTDGSKCSVCEAILVAQEVIPMTDHTPETIPGTPATCTTAGLTDGSKCSVCNTILVAQEEIPATGEHDYVKGELAAPTMEKDAFYTYTCSVCGDTYEETVEPTTASISLSQQVQVGAEYKIAIGVPKVPTGTTAHWVVFTQNTYDEETPVVETTVSAATGTRVFYSPGIPAPRMNDSLTARYYRITNGVKYVSAVTKSCNLVDYYNDRVAAGADALLIQALEAMLNYGSAAQINFAYNTEIDEEDAHSGLVNRHIPQANRKSLKADFESIEATHGIVKAGDTSGKALTYYSMSAQVKQRINLAIAYMRVDKTVDKSTLTFRGTYTDGAGLEKAVTVSGENFVASGSNYYSVYIDSIPAKDLRCMITGAIYNADDVQVSDTITTSLESYVVGVLNGGSDNLKAVCLATLGYSDAIAAYVNK